MLKIDFEPPKKKKKKKFIWNLFNYKKKMLLDSTIRGDGQ